MEKLLNIITPLHEGATRDYIGRMNDDKINCMVIARQFGRDFWDGDRMYGYGGYVYDGRWKSVAKKLIEHYNLPSDAKILDVGCGKGYLLYEFKKLLPNSAVSGFDISSYAIQNAKKEIKNNLFVHRAEKPYPFKDKEFDLVVSFTTLHNLMIYDLKSALNEIERVGKNKFITLDSFRDEKELFNLQCWALTCNAFFTPKEWEWIFGLFGYTGDYEFICF